MSALPRRQDELRRCYDEQAAHFVETRKRPRPEFVHLQEQTTSFVDVRDGAPLEVVEIGCGGGRLYEALKNTLPSGSIYTGVDFAAGMIEQARNVAPEATWLVGDMVEYIRSCDQESIDLLYGIASVQHIKGSKHRALFFADAYRALSRWGMMLLTNRSYSDRFLRKYRQQIALTAPRLLLDRALVRNDVLIPRKDHKNPTDAHLRYYHMFTLYELTQLARHAWFVVRICSYVWQDGALTDERRSSRNSFLVVQKEVR